jgi:glycosyltransferase involved in cell wall biosynthesis
MSQTTKKLKILFDLTPVCKPTKTGIPVFTQRLYAALKHQPDIQIEKTFSFCNYIPTKPWKIYRLFEKLLYRQLYLPFKLYFGRYDAYIESDYMFIPLFKPQNTVIVTIIYDIALLLFQNLQTSSHNRKWELKLQKSIKNSDILITISETSQKDIKTYLEKIQEKNKILEYIYADTDRLTECKRALSVLKKYHIHDEYLLFLGTLEPRKNPLNLIKAFHRFKVHTKKNTKLVFAGKKGWLYDEIFDYIEQHNLHKEIIFTGYVSDEEKVCLLQYTKAFLFLSVYEGFGIPPLEALKCNTPVLVSDIPVFHELFGNNVFYAEPYNVDHIAKMINEIIHSPPPIDTSLFQQFSWDHSAKKLIDTITNSMLILKKEKQDD